MSKIDWSLLTYVLGRLILVYLCLRYIDPCLPVSEIDWSLFTYVWDRLVLVYLCLREIDPCLSMSEGDWYLFTYVWGRLILVYLCLREIDPYLPICLREIDPCLPMSEIDWSLFTYVWDRLILVLMNRIMLELYISSMNISNKLCHRRSTVSIQAWIYLINVSSSKYCVDTSAFRLLISENINSLIVSVSVTWCPFTKNWWL